MTLGTIDAEDTTTGESLYVTAEVTVIGGDAMLTVDCVQLSSVQLSSI